MIIQPTLASAQNVILQTDHARFSGQLAGIFGNDQFAPLDPAGPMIYVAGHHDEGWTAIDARLFMDDSTGLPYNLTQTPLPLLLETSAASPAHNEAYHPYSGVLSSMHTYGLFHGRYGLSDKIFVDLVSAEHKAPLLAMLALELERQKNLKAALAADPVSARWVKDEVLFHNYKLLQFFDTLALYFHMTAPEQRKIAQFLNVPRAVGVDVNITIRPVAQGVYAFDPFPFQRSGVTCNYLYRSLTPQPAGTDLSTIWSTLSVQREQVMLVSE